MSSSTMEHLEPRLMLSGTAYLVDSLADVVADDGAVTLREALQAANTNAAVFDAPAGSATEADALAFAPALFAGGAAELTLDGTQLEITDSLTLIGPGADLLSIYAGGLSRVLDVSPLTGVIDVSLTGLTLTGGYTANIGGGVYAYDANLTLTDCAITVNHADGNGGGLYAVNRVTLTMTGVKVTDNSAGGSGGGVHLGSFHAFIEGCEFAGNSAGGEGGGLYSTSLNSTSLTMRGSTISGNQAGHQGGGVRVSGGAMIDCIVDSNEIPEDGVDNPSTPHRGGGIHHSDGELKLLRCTISNNTSHDENHSNGGGISSIYADLSLTDCLVMANASQGFGGGIDAGGGSITLLVTTIARNSGYEGGGLSVRSINGVVKRSEIVGNDAARGGGVYCESGVEFFETTIAGNSAHLGGGVYYAEPPVPSGRRSALTNCAIVANTARGDGGGFTTRNDESSAYLFNTIVALNTAPAGAEPQIDADVTGSHNFIGGDPRFVRNPWTGPDGQWGTTDDDYGDLRLRLDSPCIDAGDSFALPYDVDDVDGDLNVSEWVPFDPLGNPRTMDVPHAADTGAGYPAVDIGVYEAQLPGDVDGNRKVNLTDLALLARHWWQPVDSFCPADVDHDGQVNVADLSCLAANYGTVIADFEARGTHYVVNSLADVVADDTLLTLREAMQAANTNTAVYDAPAGAADQMDRITFDPALFADGPAEIVLTQTLPTIIDHLCIEGPGANLLTINANGQTSAIAANNDDYQPLIHLSKLGLSNAAEYGIDVFRGRFLLRDSRVWGSEGNGIYNVDGLLTVQRCTVEDNLGESSWDGGGIYNTGTAIVSDCVIRDNDGGGILNEGALTVVRCTVAGNSAHNGGGIASHGTLRIIDSLIEGNSADSGGGVYVEGGTASILGSRLLSNSSDLGSAICSESGLTITSTVAIANSIIAGNRGSYWGAPAVVCRGSYGSRAPVTITNSTITANSGGVSYDSGKAVINNSIIALNEAFDIDVPYTGAGSLIGVDPLFVRNPSDGGDGWADDTSTWWDERSNNDLGDLRLRPESPAVNAGVNALAVDANGLPLTTDIAGAPRIVDGTVDIGAYEYPMPLDVPMETPGVVVTTAADVWDHYDGEVSLREAVHYAAPGQTITFDLDLDGAVLTLADGQLVVRKSLHLDATGLPGGLTLDGDQRDRILLIQGPDIDVELIGLTLTGGQTTTDGGAIFSHSAHLTLENVTLLRNHAGQGGGVASVYGTLEVLHSRLFGNTAGHAGGLYSYGSDTAVINGMIVGNSAVYSGGMVQGGDQAHPGALAVVNSTVAFNQAGTWIGGVAAAPLTIQNSIVAMNEAVEHPDLYPSNEVVEASLIGVDPLFVRNASPGLDGVWGTGDDDYGDLRLRPESPAVDAGINALAVDADGLPIATDIAGNPRIVDGAVDIGAHESV